MLYKMDWSQGLVQETDYIEDPEKVADKYMRMGGNERGDIMRDYYQQNTYSELESSRNKRKYERRLYKRERHSRLTSWRLQNPDKKHWPDEHIEEKVRFENQFLSPNPDNFDMSSQDGRQAFLQSQYHYFAKVKGAQRRAQLLRQRSTEEKPSWMTSDIQEAMTGLSMGVGAVASEIIAPGSGFLQMAAGAFMGYDIGSEFGKIYGASVEDGKLEEAEKQIMGMLGDFYKLPDGMFLDLKTGKITLPLNQRTINRHIVRKPHPDDYSQETLVENIRADRRLINDLRDYENFFGFKNVRWEEQRESLENVAEQISKMCHVSQF